MKKTYKAKQMSYIKKAINYFFDSGLFILFLFVISIYVAFINRPSAKEKLPVDLKTLNDLIKKDQEYIKEVTIYPWLIDRVAEYIVQKKEEGFISAESFARLKDKILSEENTSI